jgi:esterase
MSRSPFKEELKYISRDLGKSKVFYRIHRNPYAQETICMIHGLGSNMTRWSELVHSLEIKNYNILRLDLRGHGESETQKSYNLKTWTKDIRDIFKQENINSAIFMGHSLGTTVSIHFAHNHPEMVQRLIAIDPVFPKALTGQLGVLRRLRGFIPIGVAGLRTLYRLGFGRRNIPVRDLQALDEKAREFLAEDNHNALVELCMSTKEDLKYIRLANYIQDLHIVLKGFPPLEEIDQETLVLLSKGASISDFEKNQKFIQQIPNQQTKIIDADHWMLTERPVETRTAIENWLHSRK